MAASMALGSRCTAAAAAPQLRQPQRRPRGRAPASRKSQAMVVAAVGNGNKDASWEELSATAKLNQAELLRRKAAEAIAAQAALMEELKVQEQRFASLNAQLSEARAAQAGGSGAELSPSSVAQDALWAGASPASPLDRDPWSAAVGASGAPGAAAPPPDAPAQGGTYGFRRSASSAAAAPAASPAPEAAAQPEVLAPEAAAQPPGPLSVWSLLESLATAAVAGVAKLRSPEMQRTQLEGLRLKLKSDLLLRVAPLDRGAAAPRDAKLEVEALVAALAEVNPTPQPAMSPLSDGRWNVVYTTSAQMLGLRLPDFLRPSGPLYLSLNAAEGRAGLDCTWPLKAERASLSVTSPTGISLAFESVKLFRFITLPVARSRDYSMLETIYLDLDLRIMRGAASTVYVLILDDSGFKLSDADRGFSRQLPAGRAGSGKKRAGKQ